MQDFETRNGHVDIREVLSLRNLRYFPGLLFSIVLTGLSPLSCSSRLTGNRF